MSGVGNAGNGETAWDRDDDKLDDGECARAGVPSAL